MSKITIEPDCGNSPRKLFLKDLLMAFANGDLEFVTENISEDVRWEISGNKTITGKENYLKELVRQKLWKVKGLVVDKIITHGADASVSGQITIAGKTKLHFCDIYGFKGAGTNTLKSIRSFIVKHE